MLLAASAVFLAGCGRDAASNDRMLQTGFPGMVAAGGHTSGEVMAANSPGADVNRGPAGTPGIPGGSEGNTGGAAMGGSVPKTTDIAANTTAPQGAGAPATSASAAPVPAVPAASAASAPLSAASAAALQARQAQQELEQVQDAVAARWKARSGSGAFADAVPRNPAPVEVVVRSEKLGTAPPSPDVKTGEKPPTRAEIVRKSPEAVGPRP